MNAIVSQAVMDYPYEGVVEVYEFNEDHTMPSKVAWLCQGQNGQWVQLTERWTPIEGTGFIVPPWIEQ